MHISPPLPRQRRLTYRSFHTLFSFQLFFSLYGISGFAMCALVLGTYLVLNQPHTKERMRGISLVSL